MAEAEAEEPRLKLEKPREETLDNAEVVETDPHLVLQDQTHNMLAEVLVDHQVTLAQELVVAEIMAKTVQLI